MSARADFSPDFSADMWEIHSADQAVTFLYSVVLGVLLCVFYDLFRACRRVFRPSTAAVFIQDNIFWLCSALLTFLFLLARSCGELRVYVFAGEVIGFALFRVTFSSLFCKAVSALAGAFAFVKRQSDRLYLRIITLFLSLFRLTGAFCVKIFKNMQKNSKKLLKKSGEVLYTETNN